jgi:hypothetical protein
VEQCSYEGARCLTDGFPNGACSQDCSLYCPDREGANSVTFCIAPPQGVTAGEGICVSRCDYALYPGTGCRSGYGCQELPRYSEPDTTRYVCLPGDPPELSTCLEELAATGVPFEPAAVSDASPTDHPELTCHIDDPVRVNGSIQGISLRYYANEEATPTLMSCSLALALDRMASILNEYDVKDVEHMGTYNCRVIAGTSTLSQHALGFAIDISAFTFGDGTRWTVNDDFEEGTSPQTAAGQWLWNLVSRLHSERVFNIILTPNYNDAHRNHFHVDLTSGANYLEAHPRGRWLRDQDDHGNLHVIAPNLSGD